MRPTTPGMEATTVDITPTQPAQMVVVAPQPPGDSLLRGQGAARIALSLALIALGLYTLEGFLRALAWAAIIAVATWPLLMRTQARFGTDRHNLRWPLLFTLGVTLLFAIPLGLVATQAGHEARVIAHWVTEVRQHGAAAPDWLARLPLAGPQATAWWDANLAQPDDAAALLGRLDRANLMQASRQLGGQLVRRAVLFGFTLVTLFFLYRDGAGLVERMRVASRRLVGRHGEEVGLQIIASIHGTVNGMVLVGLGVGALLGIGYWIAGVPHPVLLGALTAMAAIIPMGAPIVLALASLLVLATGSTRHGHRAVRRRHGHRLRRRPRHPPGADRRRHQAAVPVGSAGHPGRGGDLRAARPVPRTRHHGGPDTALAGLDGGCQGCRVNLTPLPCKAASHGPSSRVR